MLKHPIPGISPEASVKILGLLQASPKIKSGILFGSRAMGNFREGSDIDIALKGNDLRQDDRDRLLLDYEELYLPWKLDLLIYDLLENASIRDHIDRAGIVIFEA